MEGWRAEILKKITNHFENPERNEHQTKRSMENVETPLHEHPLIPFTRFAFGVCKACHPGHDDYSGMFQGHGVHKFINFYIYGGYRCNELGCDKVVFHKECAKPLQEINHSSHPDHPLNLNIPDSEPSTCTLCGEEFEVGYCCSICDFKLDLGCARSPEPHLLTENSYGHEHPHPLQLVREPTAEIWKLCNACQVHVDLTVPHYRCQPCEFVIHVDCLDLYPEAYHSSHPQHPLKSLKSQVPHYAASKCLLCSTEYDDQHHQLHYCHVCNFSICRTCMKNPPPVHVECPKTHQHQLHLVPRIMYFLCNACGAQGDRSPYFCLECNFMIHRECIDLPRVININRHDHRISYTPRLGYGEWKCRVCRKQVNVFYGAYTCSKCPSLVVHSRCATNKDIWDMIELEGTSEEEEIPPFEVIDANTIKHFSHDHNLRINDDGRMLHENIVCVACVLQICSEPFYSCQQCDYILHEKCANLPRKKRHVRNNQPFTLVTDSHSKIARCWFCNHCFTGFRYESGRFVIIDARCALISDSLEHKSHQHPLYYSMGSRKRGWIRVCDRCGNDESCIFNCEECEYDLDGKCALLPEKVMKHRYDDHPLFLCYGDKNVDGEYWCEACETRVNPSKGFYACNDCGVVLHISCVVGDFSYIMPGSLTRLNEEVVSNTSSCRPLCSVCNSRCMLPSILKASKAGGVDVFFCSLACRETLEKAPEDGWGGVSIWDYFLPPR